MITCIDQWQITNNKSYIYRVTGMLGPKSAGDLVAGF